MDDAVQDLVILNEGEGLGNREGKEGGDKKNVHISRMDRGKRTSKGD